jgi:hypothetical protein
MTVCGNPLSRSLLGIKRTSLFAAQMSAYDPKRTLATEVAIALHRNMMHGDIGSNALSGFGHPALQLGTT